jgi:TonB family protein
MPTAKPILVTETAAHEKKAALVENKSSETKASKEAKAAAPAEPQPAPLMIASGVPVARQQDDTPDMPAPAAPQLAMKATTTLPGISLPVTSAPKPIAPTAKPLTGGTLVQRVSPVYPAIALSEGVEGQVQLRAVITAQGAVENIRRISGPPLLVQAAVDAVKHWRYDPFKTGGVPIEGEVTITLNFKIPR